LTITASLTARQRKGEADGRAAPRHHPEDGYALLRKGTTVFLA
jgi:hypothetical protein